MGKRGVIFGGRRRGERRWALCVSWCNAGLFFIFSVEVKGATQSSIGGDDGNKCSGDF